MATIPAKPLQPTPKDERTSTDKADVDVGDEKAEKALKEIADLQRKLEPRG